ncbi:hypothetical protein DL89DRAFT_5302 [Linderina pennispora]|uniref:AB hydrolase-1 domain-containing protein n=1 Tax=Linderina pennispora TaxID=61395 RepID=A0A1Y1WKG8_9FUNG|nr:uncharacterized protein DL89DRAFT_5302 [Linderina pennispora]ORX73875.1 hypothetical protein DL89DRAFT_5302 [Linderina pennispora]
MLYTALLPKSCFRVSLTQGQRGKAAAAWDQNHVPAAPGLLPVADGSKEGVLHTLMGRAPRRPCRPYSCTPSTSSLQGVLSSSSARCSRSQMAVWPQLTGRCRGWIRQRPTPLVLLVPGIAGCSFDYYSRSFIQEIQRAPYGYQVAVLQSRGVNGVDLVTPKMFHGGLTDDIREYVSYLVQEHPDTPIIGIGFSLGANMLTKYVGEEGASCRLVAAVSVCNPFDIDTTISKMCEPTIKNRYLYASSLLASLKGLFNANEKVIAAGNAEIDPEAINAGQEHQRLQRGVYRQGVWVQVSQGAQRAGQLRAVPEEYCSADAVYECLSTTPCATGARFRSTK